MSGQVVLYFEDQADALRFALAAGSVMAGEGAKFTSDLVQETARRQENGCAKRARRIREVESPAGPARRTVLAALRVFREKLSPELP